MLISIFTPTHNLSHIRETSISIANQSILSLGHHIEWVIGYNNGIIKDDVLAAIGDIHSNVIISFPEVERDTKNIGRLKRELCLSSKGEVLVELDHDDILSSKALELMLEALGDADNAFLYCSSASFNSENFDPIIFDPNYGWKPDITIADAPGTSLHGRHIVGMIAQDPTARSICQILYAPDHFRAWTRKAYEESGGHDDSLPVCDDHDLVCKTFLNVNTKFIKIPDTLYYYRRNSKEVGNTFAGPMNSLIQELSGQGLSRYNDGNIKPDFAQPIKLRDKYLHSLVLSEGKRTGGIMLDVGGGIDCPSGWTSVDIFNGHITRDVRRGLPFQDNSIFAIRAFDFLEHLEPRDAAWFIGECWRVLAHGGWLLTRTPADSGVGASCDLSHLSRWNTRTWAYFWSGQLKSFRQHAFQGLQADFQPVRVFEENIKLGPWPCQWETPFVIADLVALKGGKKLPGRDFI